MTGDSSPPIKGQMTVDDCIKVAATGIDGKPPVPPDHQPKKRPLTAKEVVARALNKEA
jgi:hypothetical protein